MEFAPVCLNDEGMFARIVFPTLGIYALTKVVPTWLMIGACLFTIIMAILVLDAVEKQSWTMVTLFPVGVVLVTVAHFFPSYPMVNTLGLVAVAGSGIMKLKHKEEPVGQQVAAPPVVAAPAGAPLAAAPRSPAQGTARPQSPANPRPAAKMPPAGPKKSLNRYD